MDKRIELIEKWQIKEIATLEYINDECDDMKPADRQFIYKLAKAIYGEIIDDLKQLKEA